MPSGLMLQEGTILSIFVHCCSHPGPEPSAVRSTREVQQDGGSGPGREDWKVTITKCLHGFSELSQEEEGLERWRVAQGGELPSSVEDGRTRRAR